MQYRSVEPEVYDIPAFARMAARTEAAIRRLIERRKLRVVRQGHRVTIAREEAGRFLRGEPMPEGGR